MTVSSTSSRIVLNGNGVATSFPSGFRVDQASDLVVTYTDASGVSTTLTSGQYTTDGHFGVAYPTGPTVTYNPNGTPIASGTTLTLARILSPTQPTQLSNQGAMWPAAIEAAFDRVVMIVQGFIDGANRALRIDATDGTTLSPIPNAALRANSVLGFDGSGQPYAATLTGSLVSVATWLASNFLDAGTSAAAARTALGAAQAPTHGADIPSVATVNLDNATGNLVDVTGTTTITAITLSDGAERTVRFTGSLTLTNGASLVLPGGANILTLAGDFAVFRGYAAGVVRCVSYTRAGGYPLRGVLQIASTISTGVATGTTTMPRDDTIPQSIEGTQFMTCSITPKSATSKLRIQIVGNLCSSTIDTIAMALFQDSTANALAAVSTLVSNVSSTPFMSNMGLVHEMTSGTTSTTTFKMRAGTNSPGTLTFNGEGGARLLGGVTASSITITEIAP